MGSTYRALAGKAAEPPVAEDAGAMDGPVEEPGSRHVAGVSVQQLAEAMIDPQGFLGVPRGIFLVSYLAPEGPEEDYAGETWVGTSPESDTPGIVRHCLDRIRAACDRRGLTVRVLPGIDCDAQTWLRIERVG